MASGTAASQESPSSQSANASELYIVRQLDRTRLQVKLVDLFGGLMVMAAGILGFLLTLAVVDAWIVDLGVAGRLLALLALVVGSAGYFAIRVLPLLIRRINPEYAARTIEEAKPTLKNSLINFLLLRSHREQMNRAVFQAVEYQAATDLSGIPIESAVDRSKLIKFGWVLAGVMVVCLLYKILSPKDPFQTFARVAMPLADIVRPSRVHIADVTPGDHQVFFGKTFDVAAAIEGVAGEEPVTLVYSTADGQTIDARIRMAASGGGSKYSCTLTTGSAGIQQNLIYRIEAGDARTRDYDVQVRTEPSIVVRQLHFQYPSYTRLADEVVDGRADIRAIEGTRVTVIAVANYPIESARITVNPVVGDDGSVSANSIPIEMQVEGDEARGTLTLELKADRITPVVSSYRVQFVPQGFEYGSDLEQTVAIHAVEVTSDLAPEIHILSPTSDRIEVPHNRGQTIEIRAVDPDYGLSAVKLRAVIGGGDLLDRTLFASGNNDPTWPHAMPMLAATHGMSPPLTTAVIALSEFATTMTPKDDSRAAIRNQAVVSFDFRPGDLGLQVGDEVIYWAAANDNRRSALHQLPEPNTARTRNYYLKVTPPDGQGGKTPAQDSAEPEKDDKQPDDKSPEDATSDDMSGGSKSTGGVGTDEGGQGAADEGMTTGGSAGESSSNPKESSSGGQDSGSAGDNSSEQPMGSASQSSGEGSGDSSGQPSDSANTQTPQDASGGAGAGSNNSRPSSASRDDSGAQPNSDEPLHEGEAFEKVLEHLEQIKREQEKKNRPNGDAEGGSKPQSDAETGSGTDGDPTSNSQQTPKTDSGQPDDKGGNSGSKPMNDSGSVESGENLGQSEPQSAGDKPGGDGGVPQGPQETRPENGSGDDNGGTEKGPGEGDGGKSGAGSDTGSETGSPPGQETNEDRDKTMKPDGAAGDKGDQPKSPSNSKNQSDSQSDDTSGDKSGGGGEGGGQGADREGNDSSGSNSAADSGAGKANESGMGETAGGGDDKTASGETGSQGTESGSGSGSREDPSGDKTVDQPGTSVGGKRGSPHGGSGGVADTSSAEPFNVGEVPPAEKANLDYAREATDLALEYLKDQKNAADPELLDKLGWTEEELKNFTERWQQMKRNAREGEADASRELDHTLRGLGLRPSRDKLRDANAADDDVRGLRDSGFRSVPPSKYREQFNAFIKGTARADDE